MFPGLFSGYAKDNLVSVQYESPETFHAEERRQEVKLENDVADVKKLYEDVVAKKGVSIFHLGRRRGEEGENEFIVDRLDFCYHFSKTHPFDQDLWRTEEDKSVRLFVFVLNNQDFN